MKAILNWMNATVFDIEADNLLEEATVIHTLGYKRPSDSSPKVLSTLDDNFYGRIKNFFRFHIDNKIPVVAHNGIGFDVRLVEKLLEIDLSDLMVIDTLPLSWYLNHDREVHGLDSFFDDYGVAKPKVTDWKDQPIEVYIDRVTEDVKINYYLWEDFKNRLFDMYGKSATLINDGMVGGSRTSPSEVIHLDKYIGDKAEEHINRILTYIMFKQDCVALQEKTRWKVDEKFLDESLGELNSLLEEAQTELESVMPKVPTYSPRAKPKKPYLKNGELSKTGENWAKIQDMIRENAEDDFGNPMVKVLEDGNVKVLSGYNPPNINSPSQIKDFLFSKGWEPISFKYVRDKEAFDQWIKDKPREGSPRQFWTLWKNSRPVDRKVPQVSVDGKHGKELCQSVVALAEDVPEIMAYSKYTTIKHRRDLLKGFKENMSSDGYLEASAGGLTNTFRLKHRGIVNLPGVDKPYGKNVRGALIAGEGEISLGSDLSSLEDRIKQHFMIPLDPEYVETMLGENYDPHLMMAKVAGFITEEEMIAHINGDETDRTKSSRKLGKSCLPVDNTEVLTKDGWKYYSEISVGDEVLSLNMDSNKSEFSTVLDTVFYKDRETVNMNQRNLTLESTGDHRWVISKMGDSSIRSYKTTDELNKSHNVVTTAEYVGGTSDISVAEAEVLGWVLSDGHIKCSEFTGRTSQGFDGRRQSVKMSLAQDPSKFLEEMRQSVINAGLSFNEHTQSNGVHVLTISQPSARDYLNKLGVDLKDKRDIDFTKVILSMSREALEGFARAFWLGDGRTLGKDYGKTLTIYQNKGSTEEAIKLAYYLLGYDVSVGGDRSFSARPRKHITMQKIKKSSGRSTDVFCLTTGNGNFVIRQNGKITITGNCNYAAVYNSGPPTLARTAKIDLDTAKKLLEGYWKLNWSVKAIAEEQCVFVCSRGHKWLINPINGFCYSLRKESDRFSTLCQGTGAFMFDMWVDRILDKMYGRYKTRRLTGQFHDEYISVFKDTPENRETMTRFTKEAIQEVSEEFKMRRPLDCDVQFGKSYAEIH